VKLGRTLPIIALVYVIEGFPMGVHDLWPVYLREHGVSLTEIGLLSALGLAWSLKVFWSPLVDRFGDHRLWIGGSMAAMALALLWLASTDAHQISVYLWFALGMYCLASATQDIAIDAYSIGITNRGDEGPVTSVKAVAYRGGMLLATALLLLPRWIGWPGTFIVAATLSTAMAACVFATPRVEFFARAKGETGATAKRGAASTARTSFAGDAETTQSVAPNATRSAASKQELLPAMRRWLGAGQGVAVVAFVMLFRLGDLAMGPMLNTFWVDRGLSLEEIALVSKALGIGAFVLGAAAGGWVVARMGISWALWILGGFALLSNLGYATVAAFPEIGRPGIYAAALIESATSGLVSTAFLSYLMRICEREHAAVQYALLTAAYRVVGVPAASISGYLTDQLGYAAYFALTALLALPAFAVLPRAAKRI
jgi:PAT family beta-lactamase induction signal transducer AmpG